MKKKYIKFSDERNKRYSVKTIISENNGVVQVIKSPIFEEGEQHIDKIISNYDILSNAYDVRPCKSWRCDEGVTFEYVKGESLTNKYLRAILNRDKTLYMSLLNEHKQIIIGKNDNKTVYESNPSFQEIFGEDDSFVGCQGLKNSNFDAISSNVIYQEDEPVFIDYEWVYDFVIPSDLVLYHCISDMYLHDSSFEEFMPLAEVLNYLDIKISKDVLQKAMERFHKYIISESENVCYALVKAICLKNKNTLEDILHEKLVCQCEIDRLQGVITNANDKLLNKETEIANLNTRLYEKEVEITKEIASLNTRLYDTEVDKANKEFELNNVKNELDTIAFELAQSKEELARTMEELTKTQGELNEIYESKIWKILNKLR